MTIQYIHYFISCDHNGPRVCNRHDNKSYTKSNIVGVRLQVNFRAYVPFEKT